MSFLEHQIYACYSVVLKNGNIMQQGAKLTSLWQEISKAGIVSTNIAGILEGKESLY